VLLRSAGCLLIPLLVISGPRAAQCMPVAIGNPGFAAELGSRANPNLDDCAVGSALARFTCAVLAAQEDANAVRDFASRPHATGLDAIGYAYHSGRGVAVASDYFLSLATFGGTRRHDTGVGEIQRAETIPVRTATAPHAVYGTACDRSDRSGIRRASGVMPVTETPGTPIAFATESGASLRQPQE
jgi:hypothetical protein